MTNRRPPEARPRGAEAADDHGAAQRPTHRNELAPHAHFLLTRLGVWSAALACAVALALESAPARADLEWVPEGRFHAGYAFAVQGGGSTAPDRNFQLVTGRLGTRVLVLPGLSVRAVGEILARNPSRRVGDLRLGYAEWQGESLGTVRLGQVPTYRDLEEEWLRDPILGPGVGAAAGFFSAGGVGASWSGRLPTDLATASADFIGTLTEGPMLASLDPNPLASAFLGTGPALQGHVGALLPQDWTAHLYGRYGVLEDFQAAAGVGRMLGDVDLFALVAASGSNPVVTLPGKDPATGETTRSDPVQVPLAADAGLQLRARYNLGNLLVSLWRTDLVARAAVVTRNVTNTATVYPEFPAPAPRTDLRTTLGAVYRVTDFASVALDLTEDRAVAPASTASLFAGVRVGVQF